MKGQVIRLLTLAVLWAAVAIFPMNIRGGTLRQGLVEVPLQKFNRYCMALCANHYREAISRCRSLPASAAKSCELAAREAFEQCVSDCNRSR